jgi:hypothetical protein
MRTVMKGEIKMAMVDRTRRPNFAVPRISGPTGRAAFGSRKESCQSLKAPYINFGKDNSLSRDNYVYILGMERDPSGYYDSISLTRAPKTSVKDVATHEYFAGFSSHGDPRWSTTYIERVSIHSDPGNIHWGATINFNPVLSWYLLCYFRDNSANLKCFDSAEPWGSWT